MPRALLLSSSLRVGACDDLDLDAGGSSGSGGRALTFVFSVSPFLRATLDDGFTADNHSVAQVSALLQSAHGHRVIIPSIAMPRATVFIITLTVSNFLGYSGSTTIIVSKLNIPVPVLKIQV